MKPLKITATFIFLSLVQWSFVAAAPTAKIKFIENNLEIALQKAEAEGKLVMVDFWATWCSPCKWMDEQTFSRPEVANYLNENYITVKVNVDNFDGMTYKNKFDIRYLPTIMVLDPAGKVIKKYEEALAPSKLLRVLKDHDENKVLPPYVNRNMVASIEKPSVLREKESKANNSVRTAPAPRYNPVTTGTSKAKIADNTKKYSLSTPVTRANTETITSVTNRTEPAKTTTPTYDGNIYKANDPGKIRDSPVAPSNNFSPSASDAVSDIGLYQMNVRKAPRNGWSVQVGAYYDYKNVLVEVAKFQKSFAEEVLVHISELGGTTCYKVMLGHYNSYEEATNDKKILVEAGARDAFVKDLTTL